MRGYGHPAYALSLSDFGTPRLLTRSGGWILERSIDGFSCHDAMGCYPLFVCEDWSQLEADLDQVEGLISLSLVTDPFGDFDRENLRRCFPDLLTPFKRHFVIDLSRGPETFVDPHHRRNARKGLSKLTVGKCADPSDVLDDWIDLYRTLIERHGITGVAAFSRESFAKQLAVPGIVAFQAVYEDATVGVLLWYEQGNRAYYHLGAYSVSGYELKASFALFDYSIKYFAQREFEWLSLGSGAGLGSSEASGLSRFKQGWSTGSRPAYFCGRIFDRETYEEIVKTRPLLPKKYFPAYRAGEFR
jgi:GNAT acetyltransferase-like protein